MQSWHLRSGIKFAISAFGGIGLLLASFVDCSFVPLPLVTDVGVIDLSLRHPRWMPYYAAMATIGSLVGCLVIYYLARKGGQVYYRRTQARTPAAVGKFIQKYPLACVFFPAVAPFPVPFKPFVVAEGVFQVPITLFVIGTLSGRGCLFFFEGFLGVKYGAAAIEALRTQKWLSAAIGLGLIAIFLVIRRLASVLSARVPQAN
jgi:membrane protein YqaA with SNARE-associated domain